MVIQSSSEETKVDYGNQLVQLGELNLSHHLALIKQEDILLQTALLWVQSTHSSRAPVDTEISLSKTHGCLPSIEVVPIPPPPLCSWRLAGGYGQWGHPETGGLVSGRRR